MMELQELLAQIESISARDVEVGRVLKGIVLYLAKLERDASPAKSKEEKTNAN